MKYKLPPLPEHIFIPSGLGFTKDDMQAYAIAAIVAQGVPDGWNPTDDELTAIYKKANGEDTGKAQPLTTQRIFKAMRAMLASAPPAPQAKPQPLSDEQDREQEQSK